MFFIECTTCVRLAIDQSIYRQIKSICNALTPNHSLFIVWLIENMPTIDWAIWNVRNKCSQHTTPIAEVRSKTIERIWTFKIYYNRKHKLLLLLQSVCARCYVRWFHRNYSSCGLCCLLFFKKLKETKTRTTLCRFFCCYLLINKNMLLAFDFCSAPCVRTSYFCFVS